MSRFRGKGVRQKDTPKKVEYILANFLVKNTITLLYAPPKQGKSMFSCGLSKWIYKNTDLYIEYFDNDNPLTALSDRGVSKLWEELEDRFDYIHPEGLEAATRDDKVVVVDCKDALELLVKDADTLTKNYDDTVFIFDSATDFCDESNDNSVKIFMGKMKTLRLAGATVIILHHTNKKDPNYKGSTVFKSASDNIYKLTMEYEDLDAKTYKLEVDSARFRVSDCAFALKENYDLEILEWDEVCIPVSTQKEISSITTVLSQNKEPMTQGELLEKALNTNSTNKTATALLEKYDGKYWTSKKEGRSKIYSII